MFRRSEDTAGRFCPSCAGRRGPGKTYSHCTAHDTDCNSYFNKMRGSTFDLDPKSSLAESITYGGEIGWVVKDEPTRRRHWRGGRPFLWGVGLWCAVVGVPS